MPKGAYTAKQERKADHIAEGYRQDGVSKEEAEERAQVDRLQRVVDSLQAAARAIQRDPRTQERVARESFGMIRRGEFLFRIVPGDSAP